MLARVELRLARRQRSFWGSRLQALRERLCLPQVLAYVLAARKAQLNARRQRSAWGAALRALRGLTALVDSGQPSAGAWAAGGSAAAGDLSASADPRLRPRQYKDARVARPSAWTDSCATPRGSWLCIRGPERGPPAAPAPV